MATVLERTTALRGLRCRSCHLLQPADERYVCAECYGPIEPEYDLSSRSSESLRDEIERGPRSLWRYAPFLPVAEPLSHYPVGWTPLLPAPRLRFLTARASRCAGGLCSCSAAVRAAVRSAEL